MDWISSSIQFFSSHKGIDSENNEPLNQANRMLDFANTTLLEKYKMMLSQNRRIEAVNELIQQCVKLYEAGKVIEVLEKNLIETDNNADVRGFIKAMNQVRDSFPFFKSKVDSTSEMHLDWAKNVLDGANYTLLSKYSVMLTKNSKQFDRDYLLARLPMNLHSSCEDDVRIVFYESDCPHGGPYFTEFSSTTLLAPEICVTLRDITKELSKSGLQLNCLQIYRDIRSSILELNIQDLGLQSFSGVGKEQLESQKNMKLWAESIHIIVKVLFASEAISCARIFGALKLSPDHCYCEAMRKNLLTLVGYGKSIVTTKCDVKGLHMLESIQKNVHDSISEVIKCFSGREASILFESGGGGVSGEIARLEFQDPQDRQLKVPEADVLQPTFKSLIQISGMPMQGNKEALMR